jgi:hypothetical protein
MSRVLRRLSIIGALLAALCSPLAWGGSAAGGSRAQEIRLAVQSLGGPRALIGFNMEYNGQLPIRIYKSDFPWGIRHSLILVVICLDGARTLIPELEYIDDPEPAVITVQPGQKYHGVISLAERFPTLSGCIASRDALAFWSYQLEPIGAAPLARLSGGVVVKK